MKLFGFYDSDWTGNINDMKSTLSYVFSLRPGIIFWALKK